MQGIPKFSMADADRAFAVWGANCGPGAIAAIAGLTLDELRPHMGDFEMKHYTNPTLMWQVLRSLGIGYKVNRLGHWPNYGLARIQWHGPWTEPGANPRWAYRQTHWVGARRDGSMAVEVFDINAMQVGGWISLDVWRTRVVPWLLREAVPRASGGWSIAHTVEIVPESISNAAQRATQTREAV